MPIILDYMKVLHKIKRSFFINSKIDSIGVSILTKSFEGDEAAICKGSYR